MARDWGVEGWQSPQFIIIGAQRARSTFLQRCMAEHPGISMPRFEVPYFEDPYYAAPDEGVMARAFTKETRGRVLGFKRPEVFHRSECAARVGLELPSARLILLLREPLSRTISAYVHYVSSSVIPAVPINAGLRNILEGSWRTAYPQSAEVVEYSKYSEALKRYLALFERSSMLILYDEDFRVRPAATLAECFAFVGVEATFRPAGLSRRINQGVYNRAGQRLVRAGTRSMHSHDETTGALRTDQHWRTRGANRTLGALNRLLLSRLKSHPPELDDELHGRLSSMYRRDVDGLTDLVGRAPPAPWKAALKPRA
jgi:hypothetical protein